MRLEITPYAYSGPKTQALPRLSVEKAEELDKLKATLQQTVDTLKQGQIDVAEQRKSMAQQRVERLKETIKVMRQMPGLDAKGATRMAAGMAKELTAAVKDYEQAGGKDASAANMAETQGGSTLSTGADLYKNIQQYQAAAPQKNKDAEYFILQAQDVADALKIIVDSGKTGSNRNFFSFQHFDTRSAERSLAEVRNSLGALGRT